METRSNFTTGAVALPEALRNLRRKLGVSQQELARKLDTTQCSVSHWETASRRPQRLRRRLIAELCAEHGIIVAD